MKKWIVLFWVGVFWVGCRSHSDSVIRIDMSEIRGEIDLKFGDIATDCRLVRLETKPEALLEGWFKIWVGDRYIVTYGNEEMHLFSAIGEHIRRLSVNGRGPGEFEYISCLTVDEKTDRLYFSDVGKQNSLSVIDLKTGEFVKEFELPSARPEEMVLVHDSVLFCLPAYRKAAYELYQVTLDGDFLEGFPRQQPIGTKIMNDPFLIVHENACYFMPVGTDTLFRVVDGQKIPQCIFDGLRAVDGEKGKEMGTTVSIRYYSTDYMFVQLQYLKRMERKFGENVYTFDGDPDVCLVAWEDGQVKRVRGIYVDELHYIMTDYDLMISEKYVCQAISAMEFREHIQTDDISYRSWYTHMKDDDNPVLLIGKRF